MHPYLLLTALVVSVPLLGQGQLPSPIRPAGPTTNLADSVGLQAARHGDGLIGGGRHYGVQFGARGMTFQPALGRTCPTTQHLALAATAVVRGGSVVQPLAPDTAPTARELRAEYRHGDGIRERFDVRPEGVELSWWFAAPLPGSGDLSVRYAVDSSLGEPTAADGGLVFAGEHGGVRIGGVTGIDANGRTVAGAMQWTGDGLELSLPESFVTTATYPIVLDPLVSTSFPISAVANDDGEPDVAYDATTNRYLVVWQRPLSATSVQVRGQLVAANGTLSGSTIFFNSSGVCSPPRVANLGVRDRFGVVWTQTVTSPTLHTVEFETVEAGSGALGNQIAVAWSSTDAFAFADIGCQTEAPVGQSRGFVVTFEDNEFDEIRGVRVWFTSADALTVFGEYTIWANGGLLGPFYSQPQISRAASSDGRLLVVAQRTAFVGGDQIVGAVVNAGSSTPQLLGTLVTSSNPDLNLPDVDGYAGKWVLAYEREGDTAGPFVTYDAVRMVPVTLDAAGTAFVVGASTSFGGTQLISATFPTVGYTPGRTWIGYRSIGAIGPTTTSRVAAIDSQSCANCNDSFSATTQGGPRIVVATGTSGGATNVETALAVWHDTSDDISGQRLINYGTSGGTVNLGGGCGSAGTQSYSHDPGIGSSGIRCTLNGIPATTLAAIFNFSSPVPTLACGACAWVPFQVTLSPPILGTSAFVEFGILCEPSLVGAQFESQWTTIDFTQSPCPLFPGLALSDRRLVTIGQ